MVRCRIGVDGGPGELRRATQNVDRGEVSKDCLLHTPNFLLRFLSLP